MQIGTGEEKEFALLLNKAAPFKQQCPYSLATQIKLKPTWRNNFHNYIAIHTFAARKRPYVDTNNLWPLGLHVIFFFFLSFSFFFFGLFKWALIAFVQGQEWLFYLNVIVSFTEKRWKYGYKCCDCLGPAKQPGRRTCLFQNQHERDEYKSLWGKRCHLKIKLKMTQTGVLIRSK